jgi:hypothetical protein
MFGIRILLKPAKLQATVASRGCGGSGFGGGLIIAMRRRDLLVGMVVVELGVFVVDVARDHAPTIAEPVGDGFDDVAQLGTDGVEAERGAIVGDEVELISPGQA